MTSLAAHRAQWHRLVIIVPLAAGLAWVLGTFMASRDVEALRASVILSLLIVSSLLIFWLAARSDPEGPRLFTLLLVSFALKLLALYYRFSVGFFADAYVYDGNGRVIADLLSSGQWPQMSQYTGTLLVRLLTGIVYFLTGPTFYGISILWTWLGLMGMLFFYKAFVMAFPDGNRRLYMFLVLLYPSLLLWTSSLGKDALMMMFGGMATYGVARLRRRVDVAGLWWFVVGFAGMFGIRPHIGAIYSVALAVSPLGARNMAPLARIAGITVLGVAAIAIAVVGSRAVGLERLDVEEVQGFIGERQTLPPGRVRRVIGAGESGSSAFTPVDTSSPMGLALLIPTVLFRPFPWEARNANSLVASLEGMGLLAVILYRFRSVRAALLGATRDSFLLLTVLYALMFIFIFSAINNFGIIARQRVQVYPFVLMWIAYLASRPRKEGD